MQNRPPPVAKEIIYREPAGLAQRLRGTVHLTLLESCLRQEKLGRYSFLACNPAASLVVRDRQVWFNGVQQQGNAFAVLDHILAERSCPSIAGLPPFQGGVMGYIAYDYGRLLEPDLRLPPQSAFMPELCLHIYDTVVAFDHLQEKAWIISHCGEAAVAELEQRLVAKPVAAGSAIIKGWQSNFTAHRYQAAVKRVVDYILAGDIFQANIAQCFSAAIPAGFDAFAYYLALRDINPAGFAAFLDYGEIAIASSSPERLVNMQNRALETRPIKGTRRRVADPARDAALVAELMSSRKDHAENVMIVDLLRNDLSRVCAAGTVRVPVLCGLESYASVHHLTSVITGTLQEGATVGDMLTALFPGGSITGAPKFRAMEIIAEIEPVPRGVYCGSIGYFGFNGAVDLNIAIRTAQFAGGEARVYGGGGITRRSSPAEEYEETLTKLQRLMEAFGA